MYAERLKVFVPLISYQEWFLVVSAKLRQMRRGELWLNVLCLFNPIKSYRCPLEKNSSNITNIRISSDPLPPFLSVWNSEGRTKFHFLCDTYAKLLGEKKMQKLVTGEIHGIFYNGNMFKNNKEAASEKTWVGNLFYDHENWHPVNLYGNFIRYKTLCFCFW